MPSASTSKLMGRLEAALARHPRVAATHAPTPIEAMPRLAEELGLAELHVKRDDCTGLALGGNKVRQVEYYFGAAQAQDADTMLITGAVQSNYARCTAALAARLGMQCHIQLEERVSGADPLYRSSGNVLLDTLLGAVIHSYPSGEDEAGADARLHEIADGLRAEGRTPYVIPLAPGNPPLGALGYVSAALELVRQEVQFDRIYVASGSALTHAGLLWGLRALGDETPLFGICVRRAAELQVPRVTGKLAALDELLGMPLAIDPAEVLVDDRALAPGYGRMSELTVEAITLAARKEALVLDPVYTAKVMAGLVTAARLGEIGSGERVLFVHTGGQPALFAYGDKAISVT